MSDRLEENEVLELIERHVLHANIACAIEKNIEQINTLIDYHKARINLFMEQVKDQSQNNRQLLFQAGFEISKSEILNEKVAALKEALDAHLEAGMKISVVLNAISQKIDLILDLESLSMITKRVANVCIYICHYKENLQLARERLVRIVQIFSKNPEETLVEKHIFETDLIETLLANIRLREAQLGGLQFQKDNNINRLLDLLV